MAGQEVHPGDLVAGKYRVRTILGRKVGLLVEAFHTEFDQRVVVKVLPKGHGDAKEIERFRREARTLGKLESEYVARIIDVGSEQDGSFYLVRQFIDGTDLETYIKERGPRPIEEAVLFVLQAAEAVAETHSHNIILRELSPKSLFVTTRAGGAPAVKIVDFGTAKLMKDATAPAGQSSLTATAMFGLGPYSSPEYVRKAKNVDVRTDVWSLGAVLYALLAGRPPFSGDIAQLMLKIAKEEPPPLSSIRRDISPELEQVIRWCLAKDVEGRFKNVHAFAHALTPFASPEGQVLVDRIGQILHAVNRRRGGSIPAPAPARPSTPPLPGRPTATGRPLPPIRTPSRPPGASNHPKTGPLPPVRPPSKRPGSSADRPGDHEDSAVTRVMSLDAARAFSSPYDAPIPKPSKTPSPFAPTPPPSGAGAAGPPSAGPGPASLPPSPVAPLSGEKRKQAPPASSRPMAGATGLGALANRSMSAPGRADSVPASSFQPGPSPSTRMPRGTPPRNDRKMLLGALAALAVMLPVVLVLLLMRTPPPAQPEQVAQGPLVPGEVAPPTPPQPVGNANTNTKPLPPPANAGTDTGDKTAPAADDDDGGTKVAPDKLPNVEPPPPPPVAGGGPWKKPVKTAPPPPPPPPPTKKPETDSGGGGGSGTLLAIATGGSCLFLVNGAAKGTSSTLRVSLKPGSYSVTCKPSSGATKSRGVKIRSGETSMLTFKL